ncbi:hypothetical protein [Brachyspira catarrhinii]|uniref:Uncharacterized protein n=1 Tax=Brachyspira catarrhinii TaxID=2528966 RepID=A0ABY2TTD8_9SPIR|nr:hypothetical protein [Brachyspira catarrhinii]TKZ36140.1 hypothetical protein EZH24_01545 [Brachyspira catarrhinii]
MNFFYLYYNALDFDRREAREENHFVNLFKKVILDLIDYGAIDRNQLLENVKNITNDENLINWLDKEVINMNLCGGGGKS